MKLEWLRKITLFNGKSVSHDLQPMKSKEVYAQLKSELEPWFKSAGFKRVKGLLGWARPHGNAYIVVWCQISQDGWDTYAGSKFIIEFQYSNEPVIGASAKYRQRLAKLLLEEDREEVRNIQNLVIGSLHRPPANHPKLNISRDIGEWYLNQFKPVTEAYPNGLDIWFRYSSPEHIARWASFIRNKLPECINTFGNSIGRLVR